MFYVVIDVWDEVKNDKVRAKTYLFLFGLTGSNFEQLWLDMYIIINVHVYTHTHTHTYIYIYIYIYILYRKLLRTLCVARHKYSRYVQASLAEILCMMGPFLV